MEPCTAVSRMVLGAASAWAAMRGLCAQTISVLHSVGLVLAAGAACDRAVSADLAGTAATAAGGRGRRRNIRVDRCVVLAAGTGASSAVIRTSEDHRRGRCRPIHRPVARRSRREAA